MAEILYGVSPIGLGHASRAVAVGLELGEKGLKPVFASGGGASRFLASYGFEVRDIVTEPTPSEKDGRMRYPALWYIRYWSGYRSTRKRMGSLIERINPQLIVGDEEFSCVSLAIERGVRHTMISDELVLGFAQSGISRYLERKVEAWYKNLQQRASSILVPDFGDDHGNVHFVSPVVRALTRSREQVRTALGIGPSMRMILLSASGSGIGGFLLDRVAGALGKLDLPGVVLVVSGLSTGPRRDDIRYLGVERDNQDLIAACDLVVSTAGKSTIDEAACYGTPIIAIPIRNHPEQERNAASLGFSPADLDNLERLIPAHLGQRTEPRRYGGAASVSGFIEGLL